MVTCSIHTLLKILLMLEQSFGVKTRRENVQPVFLNYMKFSSFVQSVRIHDPFLTKNGNQRPMYYISLMLLFRRTELSRFKPAVSYCLPVTTFSDKQCNNIQSPFYQVALPKSGMNRHMPKAVIHRPTRWRRTEPTTISPWPRDWHPLSLVRHRPHRLHTKRH